MFPLDKFVSVVMFGKECDTSSNEMKIANIGRNSFCPMRMVKAIRTRKVMLSIITLIE